MKAESTVRLYLKVKGNVKDILEFPTEKSIESHIHYIKKVISEAKRYKGKIEVYTFGVTNAGMGFDCYRETLYFDGETKMPTQVDLTEAMKKALLYDPRNDRS